MLNECDNQKKVSDISMHSQRGRYKRGKYLLGLIVISLYILLIDSYFIIAILTISTIFIISRHEFSENKITESIGQLVVKLFALLIVVFVIALFIYIEGERVSLNMPHSISKKLHLVMKNNNPCFYVDSFEGIEKFEVYRISVTKRNDSPKASESYWCVGFCGDNHTKINMPFSSLTGVEQCMPYGMKNEVFSASAKKLETDTLYSIAIEGSKKNMPLNDLKDGDEVYAEILFQLVKNQKTGEMQALTK